MTALENTDHVAEARKILHEIDSAGPDDNLPDDWCGATDDERWLVTGSLREAHVHATLALVEQQRITNKLTVALVEQIGALAQTQPGRPSDPMLPVFEYLTDDERKGLGL